MGLSPSGGPFFVSSMTGGRAATIRRLGNAWSGRTPRLAIPCAQRPAGPPWERAGPWPSAHRRPPGTQTRRRREAATGCNEGRRAEPGSWPAVSRTRAGSGASTEIPRLCGPAARDGTEKFLRRMGIVGRGYKCRDSNLGGCVRCGRRGEGHSEVGDAGLCAAGGEKSSVPLKACAE